MEGPDAEHGARVVDPDLEHAALAALDPITGPVSGPRTGSDSAPSVEEPAHEAIDVEA